MVQLQPLGIGSLLDQAVRIYRRHFLKFISMTIVWVIAGMLSYTAVSNSTTPLARALVRAGMFREGDVTLFVLNLNIGLTFVGNLVRAAVIQIGALAVIPLVATDYLGSRVGTGSMQRDLQSSASLLWSLYLNSVPLLLGLLAGAAIPVVGWFFVSGIWAIFVYGIIPLAIPVVVLERRTGMRALRRAWDLFRRRLLGNGVFILVLNVLFVGAIIAPTNLVIFYLRVFFQNSGMRDMSVLMPVFNVIVAVVENGLFVPLSMIVMTVLYFDLRVRFEGLDLAVKANETSESRGGYSLLAGAPAFAPRRTLLTQQEAISFVLISLLVVVGVGALMGLGRSIPWLYSMMR